MLQGLSDRLRSGFSVVAFGLQILRWCGPRIFLIKIAHQLYGHAIFIVTIRQLDVPWPASFFHCITALASQHDIDELFKQLCNESPEGRYQLLVRKWYHERGFGDCYVTRTLDTNEICTVQWLVTKEHIEKLGWENRFSLLEGAVTFDNVYTFEKYRREGARAAVITYMSEMALQRGFKHLIGHHNATNIPALKWVEKVGAKVYRRILERHFLFHVNRKTLEEYDPPIPIAELINT